MVTLTIPNLLLLLLTWHFSPGNMHTYPGTVPRLQHNSHCSGLRKGFPGWRASLSERGCKDSPLLTNYSLYFILFFFKEWLFRGRAAAHPRAFRAPPWPAVPAAPPRRGGTARGGGQRQIPPATINLAAAPPRKTPARLQNKRRAPSTAPTAAAARERLTGEKRRKATLIIKNRN